VFTADLTHSGAIPLLEKTLAFAEARHRMLATNIANLTTPGYRARQLDAGAFQAALRKAADRRRETGGPLVMESGGEFEVDPGGRLRVTPSEEPVENLLFHDGTNARIERQMSMLAENAMLNQVAVEMLKSAYDGLAKAIRGRVI
jgi:flagellar basal-body rod protein FlgB